MRSALYRYSSTRDQASLRRRAVAFCLAIAANVLLLLMLLRVAPLVSNPLATKTGPTLVQLLPDTGTAGARAVAKAGRAKGGALKRVSKPSAAAVKMPPPPPDSPLNMITLSSQEYAASDIAKLPSRRDERPAADSGSDGSAGADSSVAQGASGPHGETLYEARWYREPTNAQLAYYLPPTTPREGWGMIACKTIEKYHVDDCQELGDSPMGSGLARAVREAAWQFLVMPPRVGGHIMVGAWVRIRIDYTERAAR